MTRIAVGEPIDLFFSLHDGDATKFVRATLRKVSDGSEISPVGGITMTHVGDGNYADQSFTMINEAVSARFAVFNDSGFTDPSIDHENGKFGAQYVPDPVIPEFDQIESAINSIGGSLQSATIVVEDDVVPAVVSESEQTNVHVEDLDDNHVIVEDVSDGPILEVPEDTEIVIDADCEDDP